MITIPNASKLLALQELTIKHVYTFCNSYFDIGKNCINDYRPNSIDNSIVLALQAKYSFFIHLCICLETRKAPFYRG